MGRQGILAPWDALPYFQPVIETQFVNTGAVQIGALADPNRIAILWSNNSGIPVLISTDPNATGTQGILLTTNTPVFTMSHAEFGNLVQTTWFINNVNPALQVTVIEVRLAKWPQGAR